MRIEANNTTYRINFVQSTGTGRTACYFQFGDSPEFVAEAHCSLKDRFRKSTGKKIALLRAMRDGAHMTKEQRFEVWMEYLIKTGVRPTGPVL